MALVVVVVVVLVVVVVVVVGLVAFSSALAKSACNLSAAFHLNISITLSTAGELPQYCIIIIIIINLDLDLDQLEPKSIEFAFVYCAFLLLARY